MAASHDLLTEGSRTLLAKVPNRPGTPTPEAARAGNAAMAEWVSKPAPVLAKITDLFVLARDAKTELRIRRFVPHTASGEVPKRALVYLHGGGWVVGTAEVYGPLCARLAVALQAQVFFVDYRLSPEAKYPVPNQDCEDAYLALLKQADSLGIDAQQIMMGGDSAGGQLTVTLCRWLKQANATNSARHVMPKLQLLIYPVADRRLQNESVKLFGENFYLTASGMEWYWQQYLPEHGGPAATHPDLSPVLAKDLAGLPAAIIVTAGCDLLSDEGKALSDALQAAGVQSTYKKVPGVLHGFFRFDMFCPEAQQSLDWMAAQAKQALG